MVVAGGEGFPSRGFWLYWQAGAVSGFGSYITLLALQTLVVLTLHGSAVQVGWLNAARWLPYLVVGVVVVLSVVVLRVVDCEGVAEGGVLPVVGGFVVIGPPVVVESGILVVVGSGLPVVVVGV